MSGCHVPEIEFCPHTLPKGIVCTKCLSDKADGLLCSHGKRKNMECHFCQVDEDKPKWEAVWPKDPIVVKFEQLEERFQKLEESQIKERNEHYQINQNITDQLRVHRTNIEDAETDIQNIFRRFEKLESIRDSGMINHSSAIMILNNHELQCAKCMDFMGNVLGEIYHQLHKPSYLCIECAPRMEDKS
jgi:hypothetical protein